MNLPGLFTRLYFLEAKEKTPSDFLIKIYLLQHSFLESWKRHQDHTSEAYALTQTATSQHVEAMKIINNSLNTLFAIKQKYLF